MQPNMRAAYRSMAAALGAALFIALGAAPQAQAAIFPTYVNAGQITACGTATVNAPCIDLTQTWNNAGITFYGFRLNVTDTASAAGSLLMDLQVAGSSKFSVDKTGVVRANTDVGAPNLRITNNSGNLFLGASADTVLTRDAANTLALRNGTSAQTFNVYNTYTDASNYERATFLWSGNAFSIATQAAGTGTARALSLTAGSGANLDLGANTNSYWRIQSAGHLLALTDNTYDIGASGANRPRNVYVASSVVAGGNIAGGALLSNATTFASLLTCNSGAKGLREFITDGSLAASGNFAAVAAGGGANNVPVYCDGTSWKIG